MSGKDYVKASGDGSVITIDVSPGSARTEITGVNEWRGTLETRVAAEPRDGRANEALLRLLSGKLAVPRRAVEIVKGERTSLKVVLVPLPPDEVRKRLGVR